MASPTPPGRGGDAGGRSAPAFERALTELALFDWLVLRSAGLAEAVLGGAGGTLPARLRVAAQGEDARRALRERGVEPAVFVSEETPAALAAALAPFLGRCQRLLVPVAAGDDETGTRRRLEAAGGEPVMVRVPLRPGAGQRGGLT